MNTDPLPLSNSLRESFRLKSSKVEFRCEAKLNFGESLYVVGNTPNLGNWKVSKAVELSTSPDNYPTWTTTQELYFTLYHPVSYRYCVFSGGTFSRWESTKETRIIKPDTNHGHVSDYFGESTSPGYIADAVEDKITPEEEQTQLARTLSTNDRLVMVTIFLPIKLTKVNGIWKFEWSSMSILSLFLRELVLNNEYKWVGCIRPTEDVVYTSDDQSQITALCHQHNCIPVFISYNDYVLHYRGYCKGYLWPLFHNILDIYGDYSNKVKPDNLGPQFEAYKKINKQIEQAVKEQYHEGQLIWIMDYQLMLMPSLLRRHLKPAKIGFVFYVPFPSSDVFSTIKDRKELITSLLCCDVISFPSFSSARHFGNMCHRYLKVVYRKSKEGYLVMEYNGKIIPILASHCGIEPKLYDKYMERKEIEITAKELSKFADGRKIIGSYEMEERLKGIPYKLTALNDFFEQYPDKRSSICVIMYLTCAPCRGSDFSTSVIEIKSLVNKINENFGTPKKPIILLKEHPYFDVESRIALWQVSDLYFSTPLRDGLHLIALEYVYIKKQQKNNPGAVIISELTGCARLLNGAIHVNPFRTAEIVIALHHVFSMSESEKSLRQAKNEESFNSNTATQWATDQLDLLKKCDPSTSGVLVGLGLGNHIIHLRADFRHLRFEDIKEKYVNSKRRLILTDYGGTLVTTKAESKIEGKVDASKDPEELETVSKILGKLATITSNTVYVSSGRTQEELTAVLGKVRHLGLAAEHGYTYRPPNCEESEWKRLMTQQTDDGWKDLCYSIMKVFQNRTNGTSCATKGCSVVWEYKNADPDYGPIQAKELCDVLEDELQSYDVKVILEDYYVEVRPQGVDKGNSTNHFINLLNEHGQMLDFILTIGDDSADEPMFEVVKKYATLHPQVPCYTVTVGQKPSEADYYFNDVKDCLKVLEDLGKTLGKVQSVTDLASKFSANPSDTFKLNKPVARSLSAVFPTAVKPKAKMNFDDLQDKLDFFVEEPDDSDQDDDGIYF